MGLLAAAVPLAIHLLNRGRTRPVPFSNLAFLQHLHHHRMRRVQLRQWLVLLLRMLALASIACAFARPAYQEGGSGLLGRSAPVAAAILLDQSYSTRYHPPDGPLFEKLRNRGKGLLDLFDKRDRLGLIPFANQPAPQELGLNQRQLHERIEALAPTQDITRIKPALQAATAFFADHPNTAKELFLLSDLASYDWSEAGALAEWEPDATVYINDLGTGARSNLHIDAVQAPGWMPAPGKKLSVKVELTNRAPTSAPSTAVDLYLDGERVARQQLDLAPGERRQLEFAATPHRAGRIGGHVELEDDGLLLDNRRFFTLHIPETIDLLLVGDQPADTYYPRRALAASSLGDLTLNLGSALVAALDSAQLASADVVALCNVKRLSPTQTAQLHRFVSHGGGLILFPGPDSDLNYYNRYLLPGLVPALLQGMMGRPNQQQSFRLLDMERPPHPLLQDLFTSVPADQPRFYAAFELVPKDRLDPLVYFDDGRIAVAQGWKERGRVVLFAAPLALDWNDLPLRGLFVPLLQRLARYLSLPAATNISYTVGQASQRYLADVPINSSVQAETPSGKRLLLSPELVGDRYYWKIPRLDEAGLWRLHYQTTTAQEGLGKTKLADLFAVNLNTKESDLTPLDPQLLARRFGQDRTHLITAADELKNLVLGNRYGRELWREFLLFGLVLLVAELWFARAPRQQTKAAA